MAADHSIGMSMMIVLYNDITLNEGQHEPHMAADHSIGNNDSPVCNDITLMKANMSPIWLLY